MEISIGKREYSKEILDKLEEKEYKEQLEKNGMRLVKKVNQPWMMSLKDCSLIKNGLTYKDLSVYAALSYHMNKDKQCFPGSSTLAAMTKFSRQFIYDSIKRLEAAEFILVKRSMVDNKKTKNKYTLLKTDSFKMVPISIWESDLSGPELAICLCIRQCYNDESLTSSYSVYQMADMIGISYPTLIRYYNLLKEKGYISENFNFNQNTSSLEKVNNLDWKITIENRIIQTEEMTMKNTNDIDTLNRRLDEIINTINKLLVSK